MNISDLKDIPTCGSPLIHPMVGMLIPVLQNSSMWARGTPGQEPMSMSAVRPKSEDCHHLSARIRCLGSQAPLERTRRRVLSIRSHLRPTKDKARNTLPEHLDARDPREQKTHVFSPSAPSSGHIMA